jgi:deoxyribonuclease-4
MRAIRPLEMLARLIFPPAIVLVLAYQIIFFLLVFGTYSISHTILNTRKVYLNLLSNTVMAIRIGVAGTPSVCEKIEDALVWLEKNSLEEEVEFVHRVWMNQKRAEEIKKLNKDLGVGLSIHAPYYINLANPEKEKDSMKRILDCCDRAERMGASIVVFHPGYYGKDKEKATELIYKACSRMAKQTSVLLGMETTGKTTAWGTLDEILAVNRDIKNCVPVIDFAHLYARAQGKIDYSEVLDKVKKFKHLHSHFSGINYGPGGERNHLPILAGKPDYRQIAKLLVKKKTDITMICESPYLERDALLMKKIVGSVKA